MEAPLFEQQKRVLMKKVMPYQSEELSPIYDIIRRCVVIIMPLKIQSYLIAHWIITFQLFESMSDDYQAFLSTICNDPTL